MLQTWLESLHLLWLNYWMVWATFAAFVVLAWLAAVVARRIVKSVIPWLTSKTSNTLDDRLAAASGGPVRLLVFTLGVRLSLQVLSGGIESFRAEGAYATEFGWATKVASALVILAVTASVNALMKAGLDWYLHELASRSNATWDEELLPLIRRVLSLLLYFIAASVIFESFGYPITALVTTAGVASLAIALAAQETLSNMLGGLVILVDRPFRVGDVIELADGKSGEVVEIGLRSTRIRQFDGNALVVPNKDMANSRIINLALPTPRVAIRQSLQMDRSTDMEKAKAVLLETMMSHPEVLTDPAPGAWFSKFGPGTLELFMSCWVASYRDRFRVTDELNIRILKAFREHGFNVAHPQQDVHLHLPESGEEIRAQMGKPTTWSQN